MVNSQYQLRKKLGETFIVSPNDLGVKTLTNWYKKITSYLKTAPFLIVVPLSFLIGLFAYILLNHFLVKVVSLLQYGF